MSRRAWVSLGFGVVAVGLASGATAEPQEAAKPKDLAAEVQALRKTVESLEGRLKALEGRLDAIDSASPGGVILPNVPGLTPTRRTVPWMQVLPPAELPPGAQERKFDGLTYYLMPVDESGDGSIAAEARPIVTAPAR